MFGRTTARRSTLGVMAVSAVVFSSNPIRAQEPSALDSVWATWQDANQATTDAVGSDNLGLAEEAARTAVTLYTQGQDTYKPETHLVLIDNASKVIFANIQSPRRVADFLYEQLQIVLERSKEPPEKFVELGLLYGQLMSSQSGGTTERKYYKERAAFLEEVETHAMAIFNGGSPQALTARYYALGIQRYFKRAGSVRKDLRRLLEQCLALEHYELALRTLSMLAGSMSVSGRDYDEALDLMRDTIETIGVENVSKASRQRLFTVVAASLFLDRGPDKAEAMLASVPGLESPPIQIEEDGEVKLQPLKRTAPAFRNIRSNKYIVLSFRVNRKGRPEDINVMMSTLGKSNQKLAKETIKTWRYLPAFENGKFKPVEDVRVAFNVTPP